MEGRVATERRASEIITMRYQCDLEGFEHCFVEWSDKWSRKDVKDWTAASGIEANCEIYRRKLITCRLDCIDAEPITKSEQITDEGTEPMDYELFRWFVTTVSVHVNRMGNLGEASGRRLFSTAAAMAANPTP